MPRMTGLLWGLSLAAGIIITVLSFNPQMSITSDLTPPTGSPLLVETKVLKTGEIAVDILKTSEISVISNKQGGSDGGEPQKLQNTFFLAPQQGEGGTWARRADMPTARHMLAACTLNGKVYAIGGYSLEQKRVFSAVEEYDPETDSWTKKADMLTARIIDNSASVVNGKIYIFGGGVNQSLPNVEEYDPATDTWTRKADMPTARSHMTTCAVNGKIYVIGGCINPDLFTSVVEEYDPATDTWARKADMPGPRADLAVCALGGKIYAISGYGHRPDDKGPPFNGAVETVEEYDPATDTWTRKADIPTRRRHLSACALNGRIYTIGGSRVTLDTKTTYSTVEEYTPEGWQPEAVSPQDKLPTKWGEVKSD